MLGFCLAPKVSDGHRQWRLLVGQLLGQRHCNSMRSLEEREEGTEVVGERRGAPSPIPEASVQRQEGNGCSGEHRFILSGFLEEEGQAGLGGQEDLDMGRLEYMSTWNR